VSRKLWVIVHRWLGLAMAGFLLIVGLTGSLLSFYPELDGWINAELYPPEIAGKHQLTLGQMAEKVRTMYPQSRVSYVTYGQVGWRWVSVAPGVNPKTNEPYTIDFNQVILNPYTGDEIAKRNWGAISEGKINLMPFIYELHYNLALSNFGLWTLGIIALIWTLDNFVGLYLTFPAKLKSSQKAHTNKSWWSRWKPAWLLRLRAGAFKLNFDLHRAGGLWLWLILLTFAWSSVYMNLWDTVYTWGTRCVMEFKMPWTELKPLDEPLTAPKLGWVDAENIAKKLLDEQATKYGFKVDKPVSMYLQSEFGTYEYAVRSSLDIQDNDKRGMTRIFIDANTGAFKLLLLPTGQYTGNTVTTWLYSLHMANIFGLPYKIFVCVLGLAVVMLSVTGIYIWLKKRKASKKIL
jgi:uncharacterized iron-regulated membrane protein